jgi:hypothetical protein
MRNPRGTFILVLPLSGGFRGAKRLIIEYFQLFIDNVPSAILPLGVNILNFLNKDARTILMIKVILLEGKHLALILMLLIEPFQIFFRITKKFSIFISDVYCRPSLFCYLCYYVRIVIGLG